MKTVYEILMSAPGSQAKRTQSTFKAVVDGRWLDAAYTLRNAAREEANEIGDWADRECCCGKRQGWNYNAAREQGVIVWEDDVQGDRK